MLDSNNPNILCLCEHWLTDNEIKLTFLNNFTLLSYYCRDESMGGGVSIYGKTANNDHYQEIFELKSLCVAKHFECCGIRSHKEKMNIISLYRTPDGNFEIFMNKFEELLSKISVIGYRNVICGDFNINTYQNSNNSRAEILEEVSTSHGYCYLISEPTRITPTTATTIDNILCNCDGIISAGTISTALSDHLAVYAEICKEKASTKYRETAQTPKRNFNDESYEYFRYLLSKETWEDSLSCIDVDYAYNQFIETFLYCFNVAFPRKALNKPKQHRSHTTWITDEVKRNSASKQFFYEMKNKFPEIDAFKSSYNDFTKRTKLSVYEAKQNLNAYNIGNSTNTMKAMWNIIKPKHKTVQPIYLKTDDGNIETDTKSVADLFKSFFANVTDGIPVPTSNNQEVSEYGCRFHLEAMDPNTILHIIKSLQNKDSCGYDEISNRILKKTADLIIIPLTYIINLSFKNGTFPGPLKKAIIKPIHKNGSKEDVNNFRPISLIPCIAKVFEKAMHSRLEQYLSDNNILAIQQNGFQKKKSTALAIFQGLTEILDGLENGNFVSGIFCDLSKAFDCVDHNHLLYKMRNYGIHGVENDWFKSYLSNRMQCVQIEDTRSEYFSMERGVPQGSVLGPLLFLLYINDFPETTEHNSILFADDVSVIFRTDEIELNRNEQIAHLMKSIKIYFEKNGLVLNMKKTQAFVPSLHNITTIGTGPLALNTTKEVSFLGIKLNNKLDWSSHIEHLLKKLNSFAYLIRELKRTCSTEVARTAYFAHVESLIRYGIIFWGNSTKAIKIHRIQKRCLRNIVGAKYLDTCRPIYKDMQVLTVPSLYIYESAVFVKQHQHYFESNKTTHSYKTRNKKDFYIPTSSVPTTRKGVFNSLMRVYNSIPNDIKSLQLNSFKAKLKKLLLNETIYDINLFLNR